MTRVFIFFHTFFLFLPSVFSWAFQQTRYVCVFTGATTRRGWERAREAAAVRRNSADAHGGLLWGRRWRTRGRGRTCPPRRAARASLGIAARHRVQQLQRRRHVLHHGAHVRRARRWTVVTELVPQGADEDQEPTEQLLRRAAAESTGSPLLTNALPAGNPPA